ncbi:MAG: extracellular solute-binding protein [Ruminococcaceae bacterium]|nr:extracellular solute-binding protein [Oscillospiraceae bacterium]
MKKRVVSLLLAALMLATTFIFAACGDNGDTPATTPAVTDGSNTPADTTVPEDTTAGLAIPDEDLEEYEFMVYEVYLDNNFSSGDFTYSEGSGTVLDEAKYKRNSLVEEKFNIVMSSEIVKGTSTTGSNEGYGKMLQAKNAGDPTYDVVILPAYDQTKLAQNGGLYDMYAVPHLDLTSAYWDQNAVKDLTIKDTLFFLTGDFSIDSFSSVVAVAFNKELAKEKGINDLYTLVENGQWTFDKFQEYTRMVSEDLNGDDKFTNMDLFGALSWDDAIYAVVHSAGEKCAYIDDNGDLVLGLGTEGVYNAFSNYVNLFKEDCALRYQVTFNDNGTSRDNSASTYGTEMFINNQGLFFICTLASISNQFRDMDVDYGILPMFKANASVDNYYGSVAPYSARFMGLPLHQNDIEITGKVLETIGYYSTSTIVPAYYDKTLNGAVVRDEESSPMLDIIRANRVFDLGYFYQPGNINKELIFQFRAANADWMSVYKNKERAANLYLKNINKALSEQAESWASEK